MSSYGAIPHSNKNKGIKMTSHNTGESYQQTTEQEKQATRHSRSHSVYIKLKQYKTIPHPLLMQEKYKEKEENY